MTPEQAPAMVQRLRAERPDAVFTISLRTSDEGRDTGALRGRLEAYKAAGVIGYGEEELAANIQSE